MNKGHDINKAERIHGMEMEWVEEQYQVAMLLVEDLQRPQSEASMQYMVVIGGHWMVILKPRLHGNGMAASAIIPAMPPLGSLTNLVQTAPTPANRRVKKHPR
jgi:hypothetical protein